MKEIILSEKEIRKRILIIRNKKVIIDRDLADLYGVKTKVLNQAVKRNFNRFPEDFLFQLSQKEKEQVVTDCDHLKVLKYSSKNPFAFTEYGVAMLSSVLNSPEAIQVNIQIIRTFIKLKEMILSNIELKLLIQKFEQRLNKYGNDINNNKKHIQILTGLIEQLLEPPEKQKRKIGFDYE